jgi:hypothetical protein
MSSEMQRTASVIIGALATQGLAIAQTVYNAIASAITTAVNAMISYITTIRNKLLSGNFGEAVLLILPMVAGALLVLIALDIVTTQIAALTFSIDFNLNGIKNFVTMLLNPNLFVGALIGAWIGAGLKSPAEQIANKTFRPAILNVGLSTICKIRGIITDAQWREYLARWGIPETDMQIILNDAQSYPNMGRMMRIYKVCDISDADLKRIMNWNLITEHPNVDLEIKYFHAERLRDEFSAYVMQIKSNYIDGIIGDDEFLVECSAHKASVEEAKQILANIQNTFSRNLTRSEITSRTYLYRKNYYNPATYGGTDAQNNFYDALLELDIDSAYVNSIVRVEASKLGIDYERV